VKVDRTTGEIMWRLGGTHSSVSDFTVLGDPLGAFNSQHDFKASGPDRYTMFDNGTWHSPKISRGLEYEIDTDQMTATLVWSYMADDYYGTHLGSMQALPGGNRVLGWGDLSHNEFHDIHEVDPAGNLQAAVRYTPYPMESYRAYKFQWDFQAEQPYLVAQVPVGQQKVVLTFNVFGDLQYPFYRIYRGTSPGSLMYHSTTDLNQIELWDLPSGMNYFAVTALDQSSYETGMSNIDSALVDWTGVGGQGGTGPCGNLVVSPNPCGEFVRVALPDVWPVPGEIGIYDLTGRLVSRLVPSEGAKLLIADTGSLAPGIYFLRPVEDASYPAARFVRLD
jgi:hypothetical protein